MTRDEIIQNKANLYGADLRGANLYGANLRGADLYGANLYGADLYGADLFRANLYGADLSRANLHGANLYGADLHGANLSGADLREANLSGAGLYGADLSGADLREANLRGANLYGANLRGANLYGADLREANLTDAPGLVAQATPPEEGSFIAYKKANGQVLTLEIPAGAKRTGSYIGRKCRAEYAITLTPGVRGVPSNHDPSVTYTTGEETRADDYDGDPRVECTKGIHFFMTRKEAEEY